MAIPEILGIIGTLISTMITFTDRIIIRKFKKSRAFAVKDAIDLPLKFRLKKWRFNKMIKSGLIVKVSNNRYFFDIIIDREMTQKKRKRAAIIIPVVLIVLSGIILYHIL